MKDHLKNLLLPIIGAAVAAAITYATSKGLLEKVPVEEIKNAADSITGSLSTLAAAIGATIGERLRLQFFPSLGNKESSGGSSGGSPLPLVALLCTMSVALAGGLTSCGGSGIPITGSLLYRDPDSGAKGGLVFGADGSVSGTLKLTTYDANGNPVGSANVSVPIKVAKPLTVTPEK